MRCSVAGWLDCWLDCWLGHIMCCVGCSSSAANSRAVVGIPVGMSDDEFNRLKPDDDVRRTSLSLLPLHPGCIPCTREKASLSLIMSHVLDRCTRNLLPL